MPFAFLVQMLWSYREEIALAMQAISAVRKSAEDWTREYIRRRLERKLSHQIAVVSLQAMLLMMAFFLAERFHGLGARLVASLLLWAITLYNLFSLFFRTVPELQQVTRALRGKTGFALKHVLRITVVTELMQLEILFLGLALAFALTSRSFVGSSFGYVRPWKELAHKITAAPRHRHRFLGRIHRRR